MKKSDYTRILSLWKYSGISKKTCVALIIELRYHNTDFKETANWVTKFYRDTAAIELEGKLHNSNLSRGATLLAGETNV